MGDNAGYICARSLPGFGPLYKFSPSQLQKITKDYVFEKTNPSSTIHTQPTKTWTAFHSSIQENEKELISQEESVNSNNNSILINLTNITDMELDTPSRSHTIFVPGWALQENLKVNQKDPQNTRTYGIWYYLGLLKFEHF
ncbi:hypothetical protein C2G38_2046980 [Gigaspora rosea]|uniref:Uncharacterized protein n=1 Tax=Gigaspora rosea TaxID=44941 RepID=A0A397UBR3_9GLOM|nr:hypothetical protein C2G38_2046980 [Gigaspora rosea]